MTGKCCNTCRHFDILRTPTGRPKRDQSGLCRVMFHKPEIIIEAKRVLFPLLPESCKWHVLTFSASPHGMEPSAGTECTFWESV